MASKTDHLERTAAEPRDKSLHTVVIEHIEQVNDTTRVFRLGIPRDSPPIRFLPGQWLDVYVPGVKKAGGFTITSTPREARLAHPPPPEPEGATGGAQGKDGKDGKDGKKGETAKAEGPYLELAVQKSPDNPPAAWLWQDADVDDGEGPGSSSNPISSSIIGSGVRVRVGGGFVWPPPGINVRSSLHRVVFVAGGVGVNPLVSMLCSLASSSPGTGTGTGDLEVRFLYSVKDPGVGGSNGKGRRCRKARNVLFLERIARAFREGRVKGQLEVFLTGADADPAHGGEGKGEKDATKTSVDGEGSEEDGIIVDGGGNEEGKKGDFTIPFRSRRCTVGDDVAVAVGNPRFAVVYICGVPTMTDEFVAKLTARENEGGIGMEPHRVLCEKWW
ncbi:hypothetical protein F5Y07DRAFT_356049 [Xylaria sp. FL0933]|nr:hypothetical protein F5Y07DRAFT_356049 [Xylaria sp. FL0933]